MFAIYVGNAVDPIEILVDNNTTIRQAYSDAGIPLPSGAMLTHNSAVMGGDAFDKTVGALGIVSGDYVTVSQKLKSALEITVHKNVPNNYSVVVKSKLTAKIMSYVHDHVLVEKDEDGNKSAVYVMNCAKTGSGSVSNTQMTFRAGTEGEELSLVVPMECSEEKVRAFVAGWQRKAVACEEKILAEYKKVTDAMAEVRFD